MLLKISQKCAQVQHVVIVSEASITIANDIHWFTCELPADTPCPALTGVPWDIYFWYYKDKCAVLYRDFAVLL